MSKRKVWINVIKFLVVPPIAVALGFYVLGPRIGANPLVEEKANDLKDAVTGVAASQSAVTEDKPKGRYSGVDLKINVVDDRGKEVPEAPKPKYFSEDAGKKSAETKSTGDRNAGGTTPDPDADPTSLPDTGGW